MERYAPFDKSRFERIVAERQLSLGHSVIHYSSTPSTNDAAMHLCQDGAPHGMVVVADYQTQGRGRRGNSWLSPQPGENLLFTVILRLDPESELPSNLTLAMGLSLRDAIQPLIDDDIRIKWVNDVLVDDKKLAGILVECQTSHDKPSAFVVGIGLNVFMRAPPVPIRASATSLALLNCRLMDKEILLAEILRCIDNRAVVWEGHGLEPMAAELRRCDALLGRQIVVDGVEGRAMGIDGDGALLLGVKDDAAPRRILSGTVRVI